MSYLFDAYFVAFALLGVYTTWLLVQLRRT